ncbi:MAG: hypothetical protein H7833_20315 [Magnetococcus sp. DMHC-1]|nr:hypothetical protein [Magnetococcales bacterium]
MQFIPCTMPTVLALLTVMVAGLFPGLAAAQPTVEDMLPRLGGYEWTLDPARFKDPGPDTDLTLMAIVKDTKQPNYIRFRALELLRLYPTDRVADFLESTLATAPVSSFVRRALESHATAFAKTRTARVERLAGDLLSHNDPNVRIQAAQILRSLKTSTAEALYRQRLEKVPESWEREQWQQESSR